VCGEPALADEALIFDLHWCSDQNWASDGGTYQVRCDYRLLVDNLMDLTHETFVHPTSIGQEEITQAPITRRTPVRVLPCLKSAVNLR
jgi:vanillate monooxygenase